LAVILKQNFDYMKISKKTNLFLMLLLYLFAFYGIYLTISIISYLIESKNGKVVITSLFLVKKLILPLLFWVYFLLGGKLTERINNDFERKA
ncbi:hypothetical protein, partial [Flavobacterium luminosum]